MESLCQWHLVNQVAVGGEIPHILDKMNLEKSEVFPGAGKIVISKLPIIFCLVNVCDLIPLQGHSLVLGRVLKGQCGFVKVHQRPEPEMEVQRPPWL